MVDKEDLLIFKMREKKQGQNVQPPAAPAPVQAPPEHEMQPAEPLPIVELAPVPPSAPEQPVAAERPAVPPQKPARKARDQKKGDSRAESEQKAKGRYCEWHPWRPAYAVCATCQKPYCYEDISEYNGKYFCLEDIEPATVKEKPRVTFAYNKLSVVSASIFILAMLVYVYFVGNLLIYAVTNASEFGINAFIAANFVKTINLAYVFLFAGLAILIFVFIAGLLIFAQSRKGYWLAIFAASASTVFFSYVYISNFQIYGIIISALSVIGIIGLRYAISSKTTEETAPGSAMGQMAYNFPQGGAF